MSEELTLYEILPPTEPAAKVELCVVVEGKVTQSNLPAFRNFVTHHIERINTRLETDEEFDQAAEDVKTLAKMEKGVEAVKENFLQQTSDIYAVLTGLGEIAEIIRAKRLGLNRQVDSKKQSKRAMMVTEWLNKVDCAASLRQAKFGSIVASAIKGKQTIDSMEKALRQIVGSVNEQIRASRAVIDEYEANSGETVFDRAELETKSAEAVRLTLEAREMSRVAAIQKRDLEAKLAAHGKTSLVEISPAPAVQTDSAPAAAPIAIPAVATQGETAAAEMARYIATAQGCFVPLKAARNTLQNESNMKRVDQFRAALNAAWGALKGGEA
jgi:hypothetical protein